MTRAIRSAGPVVVSGMVPITDATGLHARPSVKLTRLAKRFQCMVEIASAPEGPWVDAKSPANVLRLKIPHRAILYVRCSGDDAPRALAEILDLVRSGFSGGLEPNPCGFLGIADG